MNKNGMISRENDSWSSTSTDLHILFMGFYLFNKFLHSSWAGYFWVPNLNTEHDIKYYKWEKNTFQWVYLSS